MPKQKDSTTKNIKSNGTVSTGNTKTMANGNHTSAAAAVNSTNSISAKKQSSRDKEKVRREREKIVLWRRPIQTLKYCGLECFTLLRIYGEKLLQHQILLGLFLALVAAVTAACHMPGAHQAYVDVIRKNLWFITYWAGLGILSSVGLGTGLHTFLLYLGPHIASVTLAAYECNSLDFPSPPYPDDIVCPDTINPKFIPSLWNIMSKVRYEAFLWGAGTALGELPPYFMARAARLSGRESTEDGDVTLEDIEDLKKRSAAGEKLGLFERGKLFMETLVERVGFMGILACASIPNPLFDLAGITCGHFLVPFWTFFGATLIGKAVVKMHLQKVFVVIAFNETLIEKAIDFLTNIPVIGKPLQEPFKTFLANQKAHLHRKGAGAGAAAAGGGSMLAKIFEKFVIAMVTYFVLSIVNSLAQSYHKRLHKPKGTQGASGSGAKSKSGSQRKVARD